MSGGRVYLGCLPSGTRERDVEKYFYSFGHIKDIHLKDGFGFVEFDDSRDADDAVYDMNGRDFLGERIVVQHARGSNRHGDRVSPYPPRGRDMDRGGPSYGGGRPLYTPKYGPPVRTEHRMTVENLSSRISWQDLKDLFRKVGDVTYADAHKNRIGDAVVEFGSHNDLMKAIDKYDGYDINGKKLKLLDGSRGRSRSRSPRRRSRSRSRSRSDSRSRSNSRSRSDSRARSRSRSYSAERKRSLSRSRSPSEDRRRSRSNSHSSARKRTRSDSRFNSGDKTNFKSRSRSRSESRGRDNDMDAEDRRRSYSPDRDSPPPSDDKMATTERTAGNHSQ